MSSYDDLLKQVEHLRAENSHLRQELNDNTSNLSKLENEASTMKDVFSQIKVPMEEDDDIPYDDYEEEGIHVFAQGGGGESCDMNPNEEDVSPNDVGPLKPTFNQSQSQTQNIHGKDALLQLPNPARPGGNNIVKPQIPLDGGMLNLLRELHNERAKLLNDIEEEGKQRKWYFDQIEAIKRKLESLPVPEKHNRQLETARRQLEFEVKRVQDSFEQNMGTNDQIVQRQEARLQRIQVVETDILRIQDQHRRQMEAAVQRERAQESHPHQMEPVVNGHQNDLTTDGVEDGDPNNVTIATQTSVENDDPNSSVIDPNASFTLNALYHGAWPMSPMKKDLAGENRAESLGKSPDLASVMSFNSTNSSTQGSAAPSPPTHAGAMQQHQQQGLPTHLQGQSHDLNATNQQQPQQLGTKVEMVYSLLSMLGTHDKDDMSRTLLAMSSSQDSCIAMRQSGCMPLLIQLLHGSDKDSGLLGNTRGSKAARARAAAALHNIVHSHPDDKRGRREARVLRLLEQIRAHSDQLRESPTEEEEESRQNGSRPHEMDHHPGPAVAALMKLSFDEEHRHAICSLGGVQAIAELIQVDHDVHSNTQEQYNITMRRYGCMGLTNLTFGDGTNKALLCSMKGFMEALVAQLMSTCEDLCQVAASVLRNLSWKADLASKKTLREVGAATMLMKAAMNVKKEATLKSILSALWNLSAHGSENKADICAVDGALEFLVSTLTYKSQSKTMAVIENGGGVLRNISSHITVREDYRVILRKHGCLQILLKQLRSPSLTIVSNACGTLWNLSARCPEDQQALWDMGAVAMLKNLVHSKHQMISMGSSAALKNLLNACPSIKSMNMDKKQNTNRPSLHVRKQRALEAEIDQNLSETCENLESPRDSPTDTNRTEKDHTRFAFPGNMTQQHVTPETVDPRRSLTRGHYYQHSGSSSGENTPMSDSRLMSPKRVARSGSQDSVGSTHSDISHDRSRFRQAMKNAKHYQERERQGGSLDRKIGSSIPRYSGATSSDENNSEHGSSHSNPAHPPNSRILQVMKEVMSHNSERDTNSPVRGAHMPPPPPPQMQHGLPTSIIDGTFSLPHAMLYRSYPNVASSAQNIPMPQNVHFVASAPSNCSPGYVIPATSHQYKPSDNSDQPIDYSLKYHDNGSSSQHHSQSKSSCASQAPQKPQPKYGNYVGPAGYDPNRGISRFVQHKHHFDQSRGPAPYVGPALQECLNQGPRVIAPQFSEYAETDLDSDDQPTDFSQRYAEQHDDNYSNQPISYNVRYQETDPNCADCKLEEARRTNERLEQYGSGFNDDQVTTFYTEGTPLNYMSLAASMTDLSGRTGKEEGPHKAKEEEEEEDVDEEATPEDETKNFGTRFIESDKASGSGSKSYSDSEKRSESESISIDQQTGSTVISHYVANEKSSKVTIIADNHMQRSFHIETEDDPSEDQIKSYCEEGTPICFSRVSSLSSLHSGEAQDKVNVAIETKPRQQVGLSSINENDGGIKSPPMNRSLKYSPMGRQKLLSDSDTPGSDILEKEHKTVTFDDQHQVEETPLMFSRSSSLTSLSSFGSHSVHSSVISEYSRRASEVVSPSELPDSPSETMPPSPSHSKSPQPDECNSKESVPSNNLSTDDSSSQDMHSKLQTFASTPAQNIRKPVPTMNIVSTPGKAVFVETASVLGKDDHPVVYADEGTPPNISDTVSLLSALTIDSETPKSKDMDVTLVQDLTIIQEKEEDTSVLAPRTEEENSSMSEVSEGEEDILKQCISSAMPRKMKRSSSDNAIKKKSAVLKSDQHKSRMPVRQTDSPSTNREVLSPKSKAKIGYPKQIDEENSNMNEDTVKSYASEDMPMSRSMNSSLVKDSSTPYKENKNLRQISAQPPQPSKVPQHVVGSRIPQSKIATPNKGIPVRTTAQQNKPGQSRKPKPLLILQEVLRGEVDALDMVGDSVTSYATEDTPLTQSAAVSPSTKKPPVENHFSLEAVAKIDAQICDDAVKSYAIEGTPYNGSVSGSPTHQPKNIIPVPQEPPPQTFIPPKVPVADLMKQIEVNMEEDDVPQTFATEDTPINFSRTGSLSDLSIRTSTTNEGSLSQAISPPRKADEVEVQDAELEQEAEFEPPPPPLLDESNRMDDTQSDNSSVLDESDELLSEIIQSAMPKGKVSRKLDMDRVAEGSETNKSQNRVFSPLKDKQFTFQPQRTSSHVSTTQPHFVPNQKLINVPDTMKMFAVDGISCNFSATTSLSESTVDPPEVSDVQDNHNLSSIRGSRSFASEQSSLCPTKAIGTSGDDSVFVKNVCQNNTLGTSADDSVFVKNVESSDSLRVYNVEGTPQTFSRNDSLSSLSIMDEDIKFSDKSLQGQNDGKTDLGNKAQTKQIIKPVSTSSVSKVSSASHSDSELLREVEGQSSDETKSVSVKSEPLKSTIEELPKTFAVEDTRLNFSRRSSLSSVHSQDDTEQKKETEKLAKENTAKDQGSKFTVEDTPVCFSRNSSLSSLSVDSDIFDPTPSEQALLDECISSALPKGRPSKAEEKAKPQRLSPSGSSTKKDLSSKTMIHTRQERRSLDYESKSRIDETKSMERSFDASLLTAVKHQNRQVATEFKVPTAYQGSSSRRSSDRRYMESQMPSKSASRSYDRNLEKETSVYHCGYNQGRHGYSSTESRMTRSCSSAEDMSHYNAHQKSNSHESRISAWHHQQQLLQQQKQYHHHQQQQQYLYQHASEQGRPSTDMVKRGSWRRSRSQDSDGFLKRQKDFSNMEIAQSVSTMPHRFRYSMETFSTGAEQQYHYQQTVPVQQVSPQQHYPDNRVVEERETRKRKSLWNRRSSTEKLSKRGSSSSIEKYDSEKSDRDSYTSQGYGYEAQSRTRAVFVEDEARTAMNKTYREPELAREEKEKSPFKYIGCGIDNYGFDPRGSNEDVMDADVTMVEPADSANVTYTDENMVNMDMTYDEGMYNEEINNRSHEQSFEPDITPEDERALQMEASMVVTEIQNRQMIGSGMDEDMFIENETLSLVSCDYTSDTASEVSISWSNSEKMSDYSESTISQVDDTASNRSAGPRILKPGEKSLVQQREAENGKAIRGRRKPLYSARNNAAQAKTGTPARSDSSRQGRTAGAVSQGGGANRSSMSNNARKVPATKTHPKASSTPTKSSVVNSPRSKIGKPSPPERKSTTVLTSQRQSTSKNSPSRLPMSQNRKGSTPTERPKPPIKQGTFTKEPTGVNAPKITDTEEDECHGEVHNRWRKHSGQSPCRQKTGGSPPDSLRTSDNDEGSWSKALGSYNFVVDNSDNSKEGNKENLCGKKTSQASNLAKNRSNSGGNLANTRPNGGKVQSKMNSNLCKAGSGSNLKKAGSGTSLTKLSNAGSGTALNRGGGSNPNLRKLGSRGELRKSDSNASLKNNSRPSTPVGRKNSTTSIGKKTDNQLNKSNTVSADNKKAGNSGKKQVNSKIASLWRKDDHNKSQSSPESNTPRGSKLPVSTVTPSKSPRNNSAQNTPSRLQQPKTRTASPSTRNNANKKSSTNTNKSEGQVCDGISRSSTYDKIGTINDSSQLPCLDSSDSENGEVQEQRIIEDSCNKMETSPSSEEVLSTSDRETVSEQDKPLQSSCDSVLESSNVSPTSQTSSDSESVFKHPGKVIDPYGLKSLERKIDSSTWKKKKSDNFIGDLPNADETSKSLDAVKALLNSSLLNESSIMNSSSMTNSSSMNCSIMEESYLSQGNRTIGSSWRRHREESFCSVGQSDDEDIETVWVRRDGDTSRSEPELSKHGLFRLNRSKTSKSKSENKSFLPIKAIKQVFTGSKSSKKVSETKKAASSFSLNTSKESLHKLNKIEAFEKEYIKKKEKDELMKKKEEIAKKKREESLRRKEENAKKKEEKAQKKEEKKREKDEKKAAKSSFNGSTKLSPSSESSKTSPQALVPPFNYKPSLTKVVDKSLDNSVSLENSTQDGDASFVKPTTPKKTGNTAASVGHATKTEMLLARRRISYLQSLSTKGDEKGSDSESNKGCIVTTV